MDEGKNIYIISASITLGAMSGGWIFSLPATLAQRYAVVSAAFLLCCVFLSVTCFLKSRGHPAARKLPMLAAIFFMLGLCCSLTAALCEPLKSPASIFPMRILHDMHERLTACIEAIPFADRGNAALVKALILGDRSTLDRSTMMMFRKAGAAHLLALSGMHLGIIYAMVDRCLLIMGNSPLSRRIRSISVIAVTWAYTMMCGAGPSLMRAWLFILLRESGKALYRPQNPQDIFCMALILHIIISPLEVSSLGFQLSYSAMMGIVFLWPEMRKWYNDRGAMQWIWQLSSLSICAQAFTAPLTLAHFGTFPKYFLITNLVAAPLMSVVMICAVAEMTIQGCGIEAPWLVHALEYPMNMLVKLLEVIASIR